MTGRIESTICTGALLRYTVDVSGTRLTVDLYDPRHARAFQPGGALTLALPEDPHILPQSGEARARLQRRVARGTGGCARAWQRSASGSVEPPGQVGS